MSEATAGKLTREELKAQLAAIVGSDGAALKSPPPLARKPEFQGKQVETLAIAQDNVLMAKHPEMTQNLGPEEMQSLEALGQAIPGIAQTAQVVAPPVASPLPVPAQFANAFATIARQPAPDRIFLTGRSGAGKNYLAAQVSGARVVELTDPIDAFLRETYPDFDPDAPALANFRATVKAWGDGVLNETYPLTPARFLFSAMVRPRWPGFGQLNFWVNQLIQNTNDGGQVIVTRVESSKDFHALISAGYKHYHVIASTSTFATRPQRKGADNRLAMVCDQDVIKKLSMHRQGDRLNVVWNDPASNPPSQRVFTVTQWLQEMQIERINTGE